jgi:hypothetical protein
LYLLLCAADLFIAWYGQNPYEWYAFSTNRNLFSPYGWSYWLMFSFTGLLPQLLWFKKLRKSISFSLFMILVLSSGLWFERLIICITSNYRDYLPSSWTVYNGGFFLQLFLNIVCFLIMSSLAYWLLHKRKKLPFPSAILPYSLLG